ncbi:class I SAM-dependent methyltransferase [Aurantiacibacter gangjinensis]|uniref:class I SAM-dependent methyltransferase n=1 Tax=Aurantiacibacter gangjinensis TaxID=502682 RepID=UPI00069BFC00|nr:class I SAM-dependent methyltransferase [Aurantiacibacter gangjinensis]APE27806.1 putative methyltransferase [Aurantiacibacter gangjinensis]
MRFAPIFAAAAIAIAAPAAAHDGHPDLATVLADDRRDDDRARDQFRHPAETLDFFQIEADMTVAEYGPGGGWYTRVLAPWISPHGRYIGFQRPSAPNDEGVTWADRFTAAVVEAGLADEGYVTAFDTDNVPEDVAGTVDRVVIFRSLHGLMNGNQSDEVLRAVYTMLADDGMVGVVQHRAPEAASYEDSNGSRGYLRQSDVVRLFELHGFELYAQSDINANVNDPADWPRGVWTLPPTFALGDEDRARYEAIGESDRMTLLFRKRD